MIWWFYIGSGTDWGHIIADGEWGKKVSQNLRLLSADSLKISTSSNLVVLGGSRGKFFAAHFQQIDNVYVVTFNVESSVFSADSFADHVILSESTCFVAN
jgi:hypothetical protein